MKRSDKSYMLTGSLWKGIILFAIPVALTALLQQLFHSVDMMVVGSYCGHNELAAVGSNNAVINLLVNVFMGLSMGANVVIGHLTGEGNREMAKKAMHTSLALSVLSGIIVAGLGFSLARKLLELISSPPEVIDLATLYLRIYFLGIPFLMEYNFSAAILRSRGETTIPFLCLTTGGILNVFLNIFFVTVFKMGVAGVAVATSISNGVACFLILKYLFNKKKEFHLEIKEVRVHKNIFRRILYQGIPLSIHMALFPFSNMFLQSAINTLGAITVAGNAASISLESYAMQFSDGFSQAALNFVSQNKGAKNYKRCIRSALISVFYSLIFMNAINLIIFIFKEKLLGFFTTDPQVIAMGIDRLSFMFIFYFLASLQGIATNTIRGLGYPIFSTITSIVCVCGLRIVWMNTIFKMYPTYKMVLLTYPVTWLATFLILTVCIIFVFNKERKLKCQE